MLQPLRHAHPGTYLGWKYFAMPPDFGPRHQAKRAKYTLKSRNQIQIKYACGRGLGYLAFLHHFDQLKSRSNTDFDFLLHAKILLL